MKIAILSSAMAGGAGIAAHRIYSALTESNIEIDYFDTQTLNETISNIVSPQFSATNSKKSNTHFTIDYATETRSWVINLLSNYDVINIHWCSYLISLSEIKELAIRGIKILFTLHDFYYITGGCHYPADCFGFYEKCLGCPQIDESKTNHLAVINSLKIKREIFALNNVHLAAPSYFIVKNANLSGIVPRSRSHIIRNAYKTIIDFEEKCDWKDKRSILLIADSFDEQRKGLQLAVDSLKLISNEKKIKEFNLDLHLVGRLDHQITAQLNSLPIRLISHGHVKNHSELVGIFKQCQYILTCSNEDNWPNILVEGGCYGCIPIVGRWHGCEEFSRLFKIPFIAEDYTSKSFSIAIINALMTDINKLKKLRLETATSVRLVHNFKTISENYTELLLKI